MNKISMAVACTLALARRCALRTARAPTPTRSRKSRPRGSRRRGDEDRHAAVEIPQSISVVTAEQIAERGAVNYQDVFRYSAGVATETLGVRYARSISSRPAALR